MQAAGNTLPTGASMLAEAVAAELAGAVAEDVSAQNGSEQSPLHAAGNSLPTGASMLAEAVAAELAGAVAEDVSSQNSAQNSSVQSSLQAAGNSLPTEASMLAEAVAAELANSVAEDVSTRSSFSPCVESSSAVAAQAAAYTYANGSVKWPVAAGRMDSSETSTAAAGAAAAENAVPASRAVSIASADDVEACGIQSGTQQAAATPCDDALPVGHSVAAEHLLDELANDVAEMSSITGPTSRPRMGSSSAGTGEQAVTNWDGSTGSFGLPSTSSEAAAMHGGVSVEATGDSPNLGQSAAADAIYVASADLLQTLQSALPPGLSSVAEHVADNLAGEVADDDLMHLDAVSGDASKELPSEITPAGGEHVQLQHVAHGSASLPADIGAAECPVHASDSSAAESPPGLRATARGDNDAVVGDAALEKEQMLAGQSSLEIVPSVVHSVAGWSEEAEAVVDELAAGLSLEERRSAGLVAMRSAAGSL